MNPPGEWFEAVSLVVSHLCLAFRSIVREHETHTLTRTVKSETVFSRIVTCLKRRLALCCERLECPQAARHLGRASRERRLASHQGPWVLKYCDRLT